MCKFFQKREDCGASDVNRIRLVAGARRLEFFLDAITEILALRDRREAPCRVVLDLLDEKADQVGQRIAELERLEAELRELYDLGQTFPWMTWRVSTASAIWSVNRHYFEFRYKFLEIIMQSENMKIEILYFDACPSWRQAVDNLERVLAVLDIEPQIDLVRVETQAEADAHQFVGSPSIRINGKDLFPTDQDSYALGCRVYPTPEGFRGWPTKAMLQEELSSMLA